MKYIAWLRQFKKVELGNEQITFRRKSSYTHLRKSLLW